MLVLIFLSLFFVILCIFFAFPWIFGAPFEPTSNEKLKKIIKLAKIKKQNKAIDLGSGDGRIVIEMAKKGAEAHGFEINPFLVFLSRRKIKKAGLKGKAFIHWKSFWKENLKKYDIIVLFQFSTVMKRLEKKLKEEANPKARIISYYWKFPSWKIKNQKENIFVYKNEKI